MTDQATTDGEGSSATVRALAKRLAWSISNLGYPVGMGVAPPEEACMKAAQGIFDLYIAHPAGAEAPSVVGVEEEAVAHLRQCVKLVPDAGAIEAAERFLAALSSAQAGQDQ